jgi:hypothetical protein
MTVVSETISSLLQPDVDAALAWFNEREPLDYEVTGILDPDAVDTDGPVRDLRLILCGGDTCQQLSFRVSGQADNLQVGFAAAVNTADDTTTETLQAELDPPPGPRKQWLDAALARHAFVVLIFYRGFW